MMRVDVTEVGDRPTIATATRLNAPQGAKVLADVLHDMGFADHCLLVLDWEKNALVVSCAKAYPDIRRRADIDFALDMDEAFRQDNFGRDTALAMIDHLREEFERKDVEAAQMVGRA